MMERKKGLGGEREKKYIFFSFPIAPTFSPIVDKINENKKTTKNTAEIQRT